MLIVCTVLLGACADSEHPVYHSAFTSSFDAHAFGVIVQPCVLLLSMPDSFEHTPTVAIRMPNGALASLAGNVDPHHDVAIADLVLVQSSVRQTVERLMSRAPSRTSSACR